MFMGQNTLEISTITKGWAAYDRLDSGDESGVVTFTIITHRPNRLCVARYDFIHGIGYEITYTTLEDPNTVVGFFRDMALGMRLVTLEPWGWSEGGYAQTRVRSFMPLD